MHGAVCFDQRGFRDQFGQRADAVARLAGGHTFQHLAHGEQEHHKGGFFGCIDKQGPDGGDGHEHFDGERNACAQGSKGADGNRGHADDAGGDEGPVGDFSRGEIFDRPSGSQQQPGADHQAALIGVIPAFALIGGISMDMVRRSMTGIVNCGHWRGCDGCRGMPVVVMTLMIRVGRLLGGIVGDDECFGAAWLGRANAIAQLDHRRLDLFAWGGAGLQGQRHLFGHHSHAYITDARKPLYRCFDFGCTGRAIHAGDRPAL